MKRLVVGLLCAFAPAAGAAPFIIEGEAHPSEEAAAAQAATYRGAGAARVVRRYSQGAGWRYLVLVDGLADAAALSKAESDFGGPIARVIDVETGLPVARGQAEPARATPAVAEQPRARRWQREPKPKRPPKDKASTAAKATADELLQRAVAAHGGSGAAAAVREAEAVRFRYRRVIVTPDRRIEAEHLWLKEGSNLRLDVNVPEETGASSSTVVRGAGEAWVMTAGQVTLRPVDRSAEVIERFGPGQILAFPLGLGADIETAGAWRGLHVAEGEGRGVVHLRPKEGGRGLTEVGLHADTALVAYVVLVPGGGTVRIEYDDYKAFAPGVVIPRSTRILRDGVLKEELVVLDLDLKPNLPSTTFDRP